MKILVVEPHADDAFLSTGEHLITKWKGEEVGICTAFVESAKRGKEAYAYAKLVGADHFVLTLGAETDLKPTLAAVIEDFAPDVVIGPIGIEHPQHVAVARALSSLVPKHFPGMALWSYLDAPYAAKQKNADEVNDKLRGRRVVSYATLSAKKWKAVPLFKSQALFFHRNPPTYLVRCAEVIVQGSPS